MKVSISLGQSEAADAVATLLSEELGPKLARAARALGRVVDEEDARVERFLEILEHFETAMDFEVDLVSFDDEGGWALDGKIAFALEDLLATRRDARVRGELLLEAVAILASLELTEVKVKLGGRCASLWELDDAVLRVAGAHTVFLTPARERWAEVGNGVPDEDEDEDEDEAEDRDDLDDDDGDDEDGEPEDDDEIPRGGWGNLGSAPGHVALSADERFYLERAELTWPCAMEAVRIAFRRVAARYHPDHAGPDPALRAVRHEQFVRINLGRDALLARLAAEGRG